MSSKRQLILRNVVGVVFFIQLGTVLYLYLDASGVGIDESFSVYGTTGVAEQSSAWFRLEQSSRSSGRLLPARDVRVDSNTAFDRETVRTSSGPIDVIEVPDVSGDEYLEFSVDYGESGRVSHRVLLSTREPALSSTFWDGEPEHRQFHSVVSGYEREGIHWRPRDVRPDDIPYRLHVAVSGGTLQALMSNRVFFLVTDRDGEPVSGANVELARSSLDGDEVTTLRTNEIGVAATTVQPRHSEDWAVLVDGDSHTMSADAAWRARVVPARDGVTIGAAASPFIMGDTLDLDVSLQGTRGTGFVLTDCTDQTHHYAVGRLPGGDARMQLAVPASDDSDEPVACRVRLGTGGYEGAPRTMTGYFVSQGSVASTALTMLRSAGRSLEPESLSVGNGWQSSLDRASRSSVDRFGRFLVASAPLRASGLPQLYSSQEDAVAAAAGFRDRRLGLLRWVLLLELVAAIGLIALFVVPGQLATSRALAEFDADSLADGDEAVSLSGAAMTWFWGLLIVVLAAVIAGFAFLFSVLS